jgi:uncharacterized protein (TIGR04222 family)
VILLGWLIRRLGASPDDEPVGDELALGPYETAYLAGGEERAVHAAIANLVAQGAVVADAKEHVLTTGPLPDQADPLGRLIHEYLAAEGGRSTTEKICCAAGPLVDQLSNKLRGLGLIVSEGRDVMVRTLSLAGPLLLAFAGGVKVLIGISRDRPVGLLIAAIAVSIIAAVAMFGRKIHRTARGDRALEILRHQFGCRTVPDLASQSGMASVELLMAVALYGLVAGTVGESGPLHNLRNALLPSTDAGGGGGCGG